MKQAAKIEYVVDTVEDAWSAVLPDVGERLEGRFTTVQYTGRHTDGSPVNRVELLTVTNDGELLHVRRPETGNSQTGWQSEKVTLPDIRMDGQSLEGGIDRIEAFYQGDAIFALIHYVNEHRTHSVLPMMYKVVSSDEDTTEKHWCEVPLSGDLANALQYSAQTGVYRKHNGYHFFYGITTAYDTPRFYIAFETENGLWSSATLDTVDSDTTYRLLPDPGDTATHHLMSIKGEQASVRRFSIKGRRRYRIALDDAEQNITFTGQNLSAANITAFPGPAMSSSFLIRDANGTLSLAYGLSDQLSYQPMNPMVQDHAVMIQSVVTGCDAEQRLIVVALEKSHGDIYLCRQTRESIGNPKPAFSPWCKIGRGASVISCPRGMLDAAELFWVGFDDRKVHYQVQDVTDGLWHEKIIEVDSENSEKDVASTTMHAARITVLDEDGIPMPNLTLDMTSSNTVDAIVQGMQRPVSPHQLTAFQTNAMGQASIKVPASAANTATITVLPREGDLKEKIELSAKVQERLSGRDAYFTINASNLKSAGLIPKEVDAETSDNIARMVTQALDTTPTNSIWGDIYHIANDGVMSVTKVAGDLGEELNKVIGDVGELVSDIPLIGDHLQKLSKAAQDVTQFALAISDHVIDIALRVGEEVIRFTIEKGKQAVQLLESVFRYIGDAFNQALDWIDSVTDKLIKMIRKAIGWDKVLVTNDLIQALARKGLSTSSALLEEHVVKLIDSLKGLANEQMDALIAHIEGLAGQLGLDTSQADNLGYAFEFPEAVKHIGEDVKKAIAYIQYVLHWLSDVAEDVGKKILDALGLDPTIATLVKKLGDNMALFLSQVYQDVDEKLWPEFENILKSLSHIDSPEKLFHAGITSVLRLVGNLTKFGINITSDMMSLFVKQIAVLIDLFNAILNIDIKLPGIALLFRKILDRDLKVFDIFSLGIAMPVTAIAQLLKAPMPDAQLVKDIDNISESALIDTLTSPLKQIESVFGEITNLLQPQPPQANSMSNDRPEFIQTPMAANMASAALVSASNDAETIGGHPVQTIQFGEKTITNPVYLKQLDMPGYLQTLAKLRVPETKAELPHQKQLYFLPEIRLQNYQDDEHGTARSKMNNAVLDAENIMAYYAVIDFLRPYLRIISGICHYLIAPFKMGRHAVSLIPEDVSTPKIISVPHGVLTGITAGITAMTVGCDVIALLQVKKPKVEIDQEAKTLNMLMMITSKVKTLFSVLAALVGVAKSLISPSGHVIAALKIFSDLLAMLVAWFVGVAYSIELTILLAKGHSTKASKELAVYASVVSSLISPIFSAAPLYAAVAVKVDGATTSTVAGVLTAVLLVLDNAESQLQGLLEISSGICAIVDV